MKYSLKAIRVNKEWTLDHAAKLLDVTPATLSNWESDNTYPRVNDLMKIERVYNVSYNDINFLSRNTVKP